MIDSKIPGSFRDPSGFVFKWEGQPYRQVNKIYQNNYDHLMRCGLYEDLVNCGLLIPHSEIESFRVPETAYKIIKPEVIPVISYPYEWCFSQLKDAALTTIKIQKKSLDYGMSLKDASSYNIQFYRGTPILIDTLSFEKYIKDQPWIAYLQFCQHFLSPLALMSYTDIKLNQLLSIFLDGIPLRMASSLLPFHSRLKLSLLTHIHLHAKTQYYFADKTINRKKSHKFGQLAFEGLLDNLESAINGLHWHAGNTEWADYYSDTNYSEAAFRNKEQIVTQFLNKTKPQLVLDIGANTGFFSKICSDMGIATVSIDLDPAAVEKNYLDCRIRKDPYILPLCLDITNPSPAIGWENQERMSFLERNPADTTIALALIHHLAISNNLPLEKIAQFFHKISKSLIIEFIPKSDSQVQRLLSNREDIFPDYCQEAFEKEFIKYFTVKTSTKISNCDRVLYLMHRVYQ
jgi:hypothetical protein